MWEATTILTKARLRLNSTGKKQEGITRFEESKLREPGILDNTSSLS